ncbi:MAG: redox-regulated ATPase YchF [Candidatus Aenigmatarchaeota archaeon]
MKVGLVGGPNTGKSTFMKACTLADIEINNYPFTTIDANRGIGYVTTECPCKELDVSCDPNGKCVDGVRFVPVEMLDVAGLVPDAHEGRGLGNQFLDDLREADALIHVLDISGRTDEEGEPTEGYDPYGNIEFLENELDFWYEDIFEREWKKFSSEIEMENKDFEEQLLSRFSGLKITKDDIRKTINNLGLDKDKPSKWSDEDVSSFATELRKLTKPMIIAANKIDLPEAEGNLEELKDKTDMEVVPCCAEAELALRRASEQGKINYIPGEGDFTVPEEEKLTEKEEKGLGSVEKILEKYGSTGIQQTVNRAVFDLLDMIVVYPVENENNYTDQKGNVLPDAILLERGSTAEDLAYQVHSDIGESFIGAIDCKSGRRISADKTLKNGEIVKILTEK